MYLLRTDGLGCGYTGTKTGNGNRNSGGYNHGTGGGYFADYGDGNNYGFRDGDGRGIGGTFLERDAITTNHLIVSIGARGLTQSRR